MSTASKLGKAVLAATLVGGSLFAVPAPLVSQSPDNTKMNKDQGKPTADQQSNTRSDVDITKDIRKSLTQDKSLSSAAHNVKVITKNGSVTLRGPVNSDEEKSAVEAKAVEVAGTSNVKNEITVNPPKSK